MRKPGLKEVKKFAKMWVELEFEQEQSKEPCNSGVRKPQILDPSLSLTEFYPLSLTFLIS